MIENGSTETSSSTAAAAPNGQARDTIHYVCRALSALAWVAIVLWILSPKGTHWADSAGDAGLAWILLTGGGYFAEQTVRSFFKMWKDYFACCQQQNPCGNKEHPQI